MIDTNNPEKYSPNELLKQANPTLAGSIASTLAKNDLDRFSEDDTQFLKFHGIYQQDDRDKRKSGKQYIMMIRCRLPGGIVTPKQYLALDLLSSQYANNTLRVTSRQAIQFHGVVKNGLGKLMKGIHDSLITTLAACGDVARNVLAPPAATSNELVEAVQADAKRVSEALLPATPAYHQIWVEGTELDLGDKNSDFVDPLYGKTYLPRKFKIAFAIPPLNSQDIFTNCLGFIAIENAGTLIGYNVVAGGGMGMSHGNSATFPRLADVIGFIPAGKSVEVAKAVLTIHRDFGDRTNRKHARLKYILEDRGVAWFRQVLEERLGFKLEKEHPFEFTGQGDVYGWQQQTDGRLSLGLFVETGRIKDAGSYRLNTVLKKVVEQFQPEIRLTASSNMLLAGLLPENRDSISKLFAEHGIDLDRQASAIRGNSMACVSLPTCGLALAESERVLPGLITRFEQVLQELGLQNEEIIVRMTGCPNGCARPYMAEIGFVGKAPNKYQVYLGGNASGTRMNWLYKENVLFDALIEEIKPLLVRFAKERKGQERFGDWCDREYRPKSNVS